MSWLTDWFRKDVRTLLAGFAISIASIWFKSVAKGLWAIITEEVEKAEVSGEPGTKKFEIAYKGIKNRIKNMDLPEWLLRLLIEAAVGVLDPKIPN